MSKRSLLFFLPIVALLVVSCAQSVSRGEEYGTVTIAFGPSRALETGWPNGVVPTFGSVTVTVSADDMTTVSQTVSGTSGNLTIQVPAGDSRLVEIVAVPASGGGAPDFVASYGGSATVDIGEGETKNVSITLSLRETTVLLPEFNMTDPCAYLYTADSLSASRSAARLNLGNIYLGYSDFEFDEYGRLYVSIPDSIGINRYSSLSLSPETALGDPSAPFGGLAYQSGKNRLFYTYNIDGWEYWFLDVTSGSATYIPLPSGIAYPNRAIAADES